MKMRLLIVEDEVDLARSLALGLRAEGFECDLAHDGLEGLWRAREFLYAAIVLDILLPGMNGYQLCKTLRSEEIWTPILMLTAKSGEWDEAECLDLGADDFLTKPFSFVVLTARLRALTRRRSGAGASELCVGSLRLDTLRRDCSRGKSPIALTAREYSLLEALMREPQKVRPRSELLDEVWGPDYPGDSNVVEVYIRYLRGKVDAPFGCRTIENVRGAGYRIVADRNEGDAGA